jgi:pyruvate formate lyase activating enzyme
MLKVNIGAIRPLSVIDYPNYICCVLYTQGCNFRCPYCHNLQLVNCLKKTISYEKLFSFLQARKKFLDAITITGGEPTLHKGLINLCIEIKKIGYLIKLDTNGTNPEVLNNLIRNKLIDYVAMDIKAPWEKYPEVVKTNVPIIKIKQSFDFLKHNFINHEFRTTIHSKLLSLNDILEITKYVEKDNFFLQIARKTETFTDENQYNKENIKQFLKDNKKDYVKVR